jgi:hypothetical protein
MFSPLDGLRAVLGSDRCVVLAELLAGHGGRAATLSTLKHRGTAEMLGHSPNCC